MRETPVSPKIDRAPSAFADHLDRMFGTKERAIKTPDDTQDHVEVSRHFESGRRYFRKRFLRSQKSGVDYRAWTNREFTLLNELKSRRLQHVQQYRSIIDLSAEEQQLETWDAGPDGDQWQQVPMARDGHRLAHLFLDCGHWFSLARWLLAALEEVHALGFVHIDLKGDNFCLPAQSVGEAADGYPERVRLRWDELRLIDVAFSVWENRVPLPANMPLPIGESTEFRYQSGQLLAALQAGNSPPFDLGPTQRLDWRADLYSLGFTLNQILAEAERRCFPEDGNWGWTEKRHTQARQLVGDLRGWDERWKQRGQPAPAERPHGALIGLLDRLLGEDDLAGSLARDWRIVRDPHWRPQDVSVRTPPTVPALKRRNAAPVPPPPPPTSTPRPDASPSTPPKQLTGSKNGSDRTIAISLFIVAALLITPFLLNLFDKFHQGSYPSETFTPPAATTPTSNPTNTALTEADRVRLAAEQGDATAQLNLGVMYANGRGVQQDDTEAVKWYHKAAEQSDATAQLNLGVMYANGRGGLPKDEAEAVRWYRKAAAQGNIKAQNILRQLEWSYPSETFTPPAATTPTSNPTNTALTEADRVRLAAERGDADAQYNLGVMYDNGEGGLKKDPAEAAKWYRLAAAQGNTKAQNSLGVMYEFGEGGLQQDRMEAAKWYRKAADQGNVNAQNNLSVLNTIFTPQNPTEKPNTAQTEADQYRVAADQGDADAQYNLGVMYDNGEGGLKKDPAEAAKWYRKAADQGNAYAQYNLGVCYENGEGGLKKDPAEAAKWYRKAADQGNADAQYNLGVMYSNGQGGLKKDPAEAAKWYRKAADQGNAYAQGNLGVMYDNGEGGLKKDPAEAAKWYRKAADQGNADAQYNLGVCYENGEGGLKKDPAEAAKWYRKAADQGNAYAQYNLGVCYESGEGVKQNRAEAIKWYKKAAVQGITDARKALRNLQTP